jgi:FtsH-binding integral membrane protein
MFNQEAYTYPYEQSNFMAKVYGWMCAALAVTALTAWYVVSTPIFLHRIIEQPWLLLAIFLAQLALVFVLGAMLNRMSYPVAVVLFFVYAMSVGITLSLIIQAYTLASLFSTFIVTSGMFGGMALYGYVTKTDLGALRNVLTMMLWGLILAMVVNMFFQRQWFDYAVSMVGVIIFSLLTAVDTQKIKDLGLRLTTDTQTRAKAAVLAALVLYLDFLNLFLFLLRFTGNRREQ